MKMPCTYNEMKNDPTCNIGEVMLIDEIKKDLTTAIKKGYKTQKDTLRMIIGEIPRLNLKKDQKPTDEQVLRIIGQLIKSEQTVCNYSGQDDCNNDYITILKHYLPKMMNEAEIQQWIVDNINIGEFNPKIKAMGAIMRLLKGKADGGMVREVLMNL
jgi:uncharacterized protein YqeY